MYIISEIVKFIFEKWFSKSSSIRAQGICLFKPPRSNEQKAVLWKAQCSDKLRIYVVFFHQQKVSWRSLE